MSVDVNVPVTLNNFYRNGEDPSTELVDSKGNILFYT